MTRPVREPTATLPARRAAPRVGVTDRALAGKPNRSRLWWRSRASDPHNRE
jgi:hypothetical protein